MDVEELLGLDIEGLYQFINLGGLMKQFYSAFLLTKNMLGS